MNNIFYRKVNNKSYKLFKDTKQGVVKQAFCITIEKHHACNIPIIR